MSWFLTLRHLKDSYIFCKLGENSKTLESQLGVAGKYKALRQKDLHMEIANFLLIGRYGISKKHVV